MRRLPVTPWPMMDRRIVESVNPAAVKGPIPARVNLRQNAPPFDGELREEQTGAVTIQAGGELVVCSLRRPWNYVGFAVDPGPLTGAPGVAARLRVFNARFPAWLAEVTVPNGRAQAFAAQILAARAELIVRNLTSGPAQVRAAIWGMSEQ